MTTRTNRGLWFCKLCDTHGTGGTAGWSRHYARVHSGPVVNPEGRESSPRSYGEA